MESHAEEVTECLQSAAACIATHQLTEALEQLDQALSIDFENTEVVASLKYTNFWNDRHERVLALTDPFERGEYLLAQWGVFLGFVQRIGRPVEFVINAFRQHVFGQALEFYREVYRDAANRDADLLVRIARCYKGAGDYDRARRFLQAATAERPEDAEILAELADVLALVNETAPAKAFFREAFFVNAQKIEIARLESELIGRLVRAVEKRGIEGPALLEWIPVYGFLFGVLNVKRELRSIEFGRLKQSIYELERELREHTGEAELIRPRLINRYFWLIDHYVAVKESQGKIEEVLLKIRSVDANVYHQYNA
ncbi:tetratricopeptide repeat protein [Alkalispirochaeta sphaeroplastigenens]|uniref:tetratricopeptide repeat protein n=1 Tax=Alkalispirochaeta sphaeroplastigenens TaxID=1187066 RepID=UPI001FEAC7C7|nr:tetratricopeptide repeat protein [Alkalispirochaeta sphaeroplastigenens]